MEASASWRGAVALAEADALPGAYYVTARKETGETAYLLGPFIQRRPGKEAHAQALGRVRDAKRYVQDRYLNSVWWTFGTTRVGKMTGLPQGKLNQILEPAR